MSNRRIYDQVMTIFGAVMIFFYLGLAYAIFFSSLFSYIDTALRGIFAFPLFLYGVYRAVLAYQKIKENFFETEEN